MNLNLFKIKKRYCSIGRKMTIVLIISVLSSILLFCTYFFLSMRQNSIQEYVQQSKTAVDISVQNIDHYFENCISSARSIYVNNDILYLLSRSNSVPLNTTEMSQIYDYLQSVYYSTSDAKQIFLASFRLNYSFLHVPKNLQFSAAPLSMSREELPSFSSWKNIYIQPTHRTTPYGHILRFDSMNNNDPPEPVFTIWFPVSNLPTADAIIALVGIDFSSEFLNKNCQLVYSDDEQMYIADENDTILASSDKSAVFLNLQDVCRGADKLGDGKLQYCIEDGQLVLEQKMISEYFQWKIVKTVPMSKVYSSNFTQTIVLLGVFLAGLSVVVIINASQMLHYTVPLKRITEYMTMIVHDKKWNAETPLSAFVVYDEDDEIGSLITTFDSMIVSIQDYVIRQYELELSYIKSTLKMLQAQINPHFIYNTLQCFATSALKKDDLEQYRLISSFGQMLHYSMVLEPSVVDVEQEMEYAKRYLMLQKMRFKQEADIEFSIMPGTEHAALPKMTLQPLVENSIIHGNILRTPNSILRIKTWYEDDFLYIEVIDNGISVSPSFTEQVKKRIALIRQAFLDSSVDSRSKDSTAAGSNDMLTLTKEGLASIGTENVLLRLMLNFGKDCSVDIIGNDLGGTTVVLKLPLQLP